MLNVVIHGYHHATAALRAGAAAGVPVRLLSARGAAASGGPVWFRDLVAQAREAMPEAEACSVLDCANRAGDALAAIRARVEAISIDLPDDVATRIRDMAGQAGVAVETYNDADALDLARYDDPERACADWLKSTR